MPRFIVISTLILVAAIALQVYSQEVDAIALVLRVIDGDTIEVRVVESRVASVIADSIERIRLADINAPELGTPEGDASKRYLEELLSGAMIYLDVDDIRVRDKYGRVVAVVYLKANETCYLNVNMHMVRVGNAVVWDHDNEFSPADWRECLSVLPVNGGNGVARGLPLEVIAAAAILIILSLLTIAFRGAGRRRFKPQR